MKADINRQVWLSSRPNGIPRASNFALRTVAIPELEDGQVLVRNAYLSVEPAMRGWIADKSTYAPRIEIGETMRSYAVGEIIESRNPAYAPGEKIMGIFGWQDFAAVSEPAIYYKVRDSELPLSLWLGVLGLNGLTGYFGMLEVCRPEQGATAVISTAAGAVGSAAGQIAKISGCRVVGITGGGEKVRQCIEDFGFDAAIDYKAEGDFNAALQAACPDGIDAYFDNTSGPIHDAVLRKINVHARIAICGTASFASWDPWPAGPRPERHLLVKRATMQGFLTPDFVSEYDRAVTDLIRWVREGRLRHREDVLEGIESAPGAIETLYNGENSGKLVIRL